jgi:amino acid transporter
MAKANAAAAADTANEDSKLLKELGYNQDLNRAWSGFSNFAISFSIISILAGTFTTYGQAWNNGGPIAISVGWPLISIPILIIGFCLAELVSRYPTSGGIYWFAGKLGGPAWAWYTGWFNWIGLVGVIASVQYACATFLNATLGIYAVDLGFMNFADTESILAETFALFAVILLATTIINIFRTHLLAVINNISVWWHVIGVAVIIVLLIFVPDNHQDIGFVFGERINNSGFNVDDGASGLFFWFYILPLGFLLTQYTITGFDASAHMSEETVDAQTGAARGVWQSIFYSAVIGWFVLVALTFAATNVDAINAGENYGVGTSLELMFDALSTSAFKAVLIITTIGQMFCGLACLTSGSRMCFAFSRDGAFGTALSKRLARVDSKGVPYAAVIFMAICALIITLPALKGNSAGDPFPWAFFAVVSITVIGLYVAFAIPIYLRWRKGDDWDAADGKWSLGQKYKWMNPFAVLWTLYITVIFCLPFTPFAVPWNDDFDYQALNYAPVTVGVLLLLTTLGWHLGAKKWFTGQKRFDVEHTDSAL